MHDSFDKLRRGNLKVSCEKCGAPLKGVRSGQYQCTECGAIEYDDFGKIRKYLDENGPASKEEIMKATGVGKAVVIDYLKEQRLMVSGKGNNVCVLCGARIAAGTLCIDCKGGNKPKPSGTGSRSGGSGKMRIDHSRRS